jgi:hypothetical protein
MCTAIALPMPRLEPVMRATLPERSNKDIAHLRRVLVVAHSAPPDAFREIVLGLAAAAR